MRLVRVVLAIACMISIGSTYGWSATAAVLHQEALPGDLIVYALLTLSIGLGAGFSAFVTLRGGPRLGVTVGLAIWGTSLFLAWALSPFAGISVLALTIGVPGGFGVGIAYTSLVGLFRSLLADFKVLSGSIGPLGFATGAGSFIALQAGNPSLSGTADVYFWLGIAVLTLSILAVALIPGSSGAPAVMRPKLWTRETAFAWLLLALNVAPGMALVGIAVPWMAVASGANAYDANLRVVTLIPSLFVGQLIAGCLARALGETIVMRLMFALRLVAFAAFCFMPSAPALAIALSLACHGGGFGLIPSIVARTTSGNHPYALSVVLTAWGIGGVVGVALFSTQAGGEGQSTGFAALAVLMAIGIAISGAAIPKRS